MSDSISLQHSPCTRKDSTTYIVLDKHSTYLRTHEPWFKEKTNVECHTFHNRKASADLSMIQRRFPKLQSSDTSVTKEKPAHVRAASTLMDPTHSFNHLQRSTAARYSTSRKKPFMPLNNKEAKRNIVVNQEYDYDVYSHYHDAEWKRYSDSKMRRVGGEFVTSTNKIPSHLPIKSEELINSNNSFGMFLDSEKPRLAILENYKQINRILTTNYIKEKGDDEDEEEDHESNEKALEMTSMLRSVASPYQKQTIIRNSKRQQH